MLSAPINALATSDATSFGSEGAEPADFIADASAISVSNVCQPNMGRMDCFLISGSDQLAAINS